jgi:hypothetical protein
MDEQLLQELRLDPDFAALPPDWQSQIASQVASGGLSAAMSWGRGTGTPTVNAGNIEQYLGFFPEIAEETQRRAARGDRRSVAEWAEAHALTDPTWMQSLQERLNQAMPTGGVSGSPEQNAALERWRSKAGQYGGGNQQTMPLEQDLLGRVVNDYLYPDMERDAARREQAAAVEAEFNRGIDGAIQAYQPALNGDRLREEYAMSDDVTARLAAAVNAEAAGRLGAVNSTAAGRLGAVNAQADGRVIAVNTDADGRLVAVNTEADGRLSALSPLADARLRLADTMTSGINQSLEFERDRQVAENAKRGFVGNSSLEDAALMRATLGARQNAAETMGGARISNATDVRDVEFSRLGGVKDVEFGRLDGTRGAEFSRLDDVRGVEFSRLDDTQGLEFDRLEGVRGAADTGTRFRKDYFDNDFTRRIDAAVKVPSLTAQRFGVMGAADDFGQSGLKRGLGLLDWFAGTSQAPRFDTFQTTASQYGQDLAGLGAGVTGAAISVGNANNWWKTPETKTPETKTPSYTATKNGPYY